MRIFRTISVDNQSMKGAQSFFIEHQVLGQEVPTVVLASCLK